MSFDADFKGFDKIDRALSELPIEYQKKEMRSALRVGGNLVRARARDNLAEHRRTGELAGSMLVRLRRDGDGTKAIVATSRDSFYGRFLEWGTIHIAPVAWFRRAADTAAAELPEKMARHLGRRLKTLARKPSFWLLSVGASCSSMMGYGVFFWLPAFFVRSYNQPISAPTSWRRSSSHKR